MADPQVYRSKAEAEQWRHRDATEPATPPQRGQYGRRRGLKSTKKTSSGWQEASISRTRAPSPILLASYKNMSATYR